MQESSSARTADSSQRAMGSARPKHRLISVQILVSIRRYGAIWPASFAMDGACTTVPGSPCWKALHTFRAMQTGQVNIIQKLKAFAQSQVRYFAATYCSCTVSKACV